jgi:alkylhydroperoxidase family enzyme
VDQLHRHGDLDDAAWAEATRHLDAPRAIELVLLVGHYEMLATAITALRIEPDGERPNRLSRRLAARSS